MSGHSFSYLSNQTINLLASNQVKANNTSTQRDAGGSTNIAFAEGEQAEKKPISVDFSEEFSLLQFKDSTFVDEKGNPLPVIQPYFGDELPDVKSDVSINSAEQNNFSADFNASLESLNKNSVKIGSETSIELTTLKQISDKSGISNDTKTTSFVKNAAINHLSANSLAVSGKLVVEFRPTDVANTPLNTLSHNDNQRDLTLAQATGMSSIKFDSGLFQSEKSISGKIDFGKPTYEKINLEQTKLTKLGLDEPTEESTLFETKQSDTQVKVPVNLFTDLLKKSDSISKPSTSNAILFNPQNITELEPHSSITKINPAIVPELTSGTVSSPSPLLPGSNIQSGLSLKHDFTPNLALRIKWVYQQAISSAEILMDPPELGPLSVKLTNSNGETNIIFQVNNPTTKELIEENMAKLKDLLAQQNINLGDTQVSEQKKNQQDQDTSKESGTHTSNEPEQNNKSLDSQVKIGLLDAYI